MLWLPFFSPLAPVRGPAVFGLFNKFKKQNLNTFCLLEHLQMATKNCNMKRYLPK